MPTIIADLVAIPPSFVAQTSLAIDGWENTVVVSYVITLPSNPANIPASLLPAGGVQGLAPREVQQEVAALITQRLTQMDLAAGAIQVQIALDAVILGNDYNVHVPTVARAPTLEQITVTATTTTTSTGTTSSTVSSTTGTTSTATSTSATSTTTTTNKVDTTLDGVLTLEVANGQTAAFMADAQVQAAIPLIIGEILGVPPSFVRSATLALDDGQVSLSYSVAFPMSLALIPQALLPENVNRPLEVVIKEAAAKASMNLDFAPLAQTSATFQIGRASCRERV